MKTHDLVPYSGVSISTIIPSSKKKTPINNETPSKPQNNSEQKNPSSNNRLWLGLGGLVLLSVLITGSLLLWVQKQSLSQLQATIPQIPDVSSHPQEFSTALKEAQENALSSSKKTILDGIAKLGRLYHANGYQTEAMACWKALSGQDSKNAQWPYFIADLSRLSGDESNMRPMLEAAAELAPDYSPIWLKLGNIYFTEGAFEDAKRCYEKRLELQTGDPYAAVALARIALREEDQEVAKRWLRKATRWSPTLPTAHNLFARLLTAEGDEKGAAKQRWLGTAAGRFREAPDPWIDELTKYCYDIEQLLTLGSIDFQTFHDDYGQGYFERAIELAPQNPEPYEALGRVFLEKKEPQKAREIFEKGIEQPNAPATLYVRLTEAFRLLDRPDEALRTTQIGLESMPNDPDLHIALGTVLDDMGRYDDAIIAFNAAMTDIEHSAKANLSLALVMEHSDQKEKAYDYLYKALELQPNYPQVLAELGALELDAWRLESAEKYISEFYESYQGSIRARELMTQLSVRKAMQAAREGEIADAEKFAKDGLDINPLSPELNSVIGLLYAQQNRFKDAADALEIARQSRPSDMRVLMPLAQVYTHARQYNLARRVLTDGARLLTAEGRTDEAKQLRDALTRLPSN